MSCFFSQPNKLRSKSTYVISLKSSPNTNQKDSFLPRTKYHSKPFNPSSFSFSSASPSASSSNFGGESKSKSFEPNRKHYISFKHLDLDSNNESSRNETDYYIIKRNLETNQNLIIKSNTFPNHYSSILKLNLISNNTANYKSKLYLISLIL